MARFYQAAFVAAFAGLSLAAFAAPAKGPATRPTNGNRLAYLDEPADPYYVHRDFPKLITPQWVGEEGVDAVITLGIDDMRDAAKYEAYLRPILDRLKKIDGRAPVSIMTCKIDPATPQLQTWLKEGLSIEAHTADHPCPIWKIGDFKAAKKTYDDAVEQMAKIPGNKPVAFRTPCCDSRNTPSPRIYAEIMNAATPDGTFLTIDSSVMNIITANDPELPRELVMNPDGTERFRRYVPFKNFVNTIEDYPYPYVIDGAIWQFPCVTPSDWSAQNVNGKNSPRTVEDWRAALDAIVIKKGVFNLIFHPHGWIKAEQIVELIDYAETKYGKRVKFLNFRECQERLDKNLLAGEPIRHPKTGLDNGVRVLDVNNDGYMDVLVGNARKRVTRVYLPASERWATIGAPFPVIARDSDGTGFKVAVFAVLTADGHAAAMTLDGRDGNPAAIWRYDGERWRADDALAGRLVQPPHPFDIRFRDVDGDGICEALAMKGEIGVYRLADGWTRATLGLNQLWYRWAFHDVWTGRLIDLNEDGQLDLVTSDSDRVVVKLFKSFETGWDTQLIFRQRKDDDLQPAPIPPIYRKEDESNNGLFVHSRALWWQNEDSAKEPDLVVKRTFAELLGNRLPEPRSPQASLKSIKTRPGFEAQLVACEPQVQDPISFAFGPDGKLWVVEMGDYPLGVDGKGKVGGKVKILTDADGDGFYETATTFLENLPYPTGATPWRKGVIVTAAPDIFYAEDTNADGVADKREVLFTGFSEGNQQHRVSGLTYGLDGWFYGANGHSNGLIKSAKTGKVVDIRGRDFRLRPDTGEFETAMGVTQFVRSRDDWGNWFGNDNTHPMFHLWAEEHYHRRNPFYASAAGRLEVPRVPGASPVFPISRTLERFNDFHTANHFTSACSTIVYRDDLFGPHFAGNMFVSEPVHNLVARQIMKPEGTTFRSDRAADEQQSEFLASTDNWFRPTTIGVGPDGALYIADMYRLVIEHPQWIPKEWQAKLDLRAGADKGRIYRVVPVGSTKVAGTLRVPSASASSVDGSDQKADGTRSVPATLRPIPRLDKMTSAELVAALDSPSGWQRDMAQQLLVERGDVSVAALLAGVAKEHARPQTRAHALCALNLLASAPRKSQVIANKEFKDGDSRENDSRNEPKLALVDAVSAAAIDFHPGVRAQAVRVAEALVGDHPKLADVLLTAAGDANPQVRRQAAYSLGEWDDPRAGDALAKLLLSSADQPMILAAAMTSVRPAWLPAIAKQVTAGDAAPQVAPPLAVLSPLARMAAAGKDYGALATMIANLAGDTQPGDRSVPAWRFSAVAAVLDAAAAENLSAESLTKLMLESKAEAAPSACVRLSAIRESAERAAFRAAEPAELRTSALSLLGRPGAKLDERLAEIRDKLFNPQTPDAVQIAAVSAIVRARADVAPDLLLSRWKQSPPAVREAMLDALMSRPAWAVRLLEAVERGTLLPQDFSPARRQALVTHKDVNVRGRAGVLLMRGNPDRIAVLNSLAAVRTTPGDAARGVAVFAKACAACHRAGGQNDALGNAVGPDLSGVGDKSVDGLLAAIIDPNRAVEPKYINYVIETRAGDTLSGILAGESGGGVLLIGPDGKKQEVLRSDITQMRGTGLSLMPEGLEAGLTVQDIADLIAYIQKPPGELLKGK